MRERRAAVFGLLLALTLPALANITSSSLTGRVSIGGTPAGGVAVTVSSAALQEPRATVTNAQGRYWLGALPPGVYEVTFSLPGHTTFTRRAVLELARVARADATLEESPDEDSTTSTATTLSVADTIAVTSPFDDRTLDRMPFGRVDTASLAPGADFGIFTLTDGVPSGAVTSEETIEQVTVVRGAAPAEWEGLAGNTTAMRTRSGGEDFSFTLRDTITSSGWNDVENPHLPMQDDRVMHFGEAALGGAIAPRLWFFAAAWRGEQAFPHALERNGSMVKVDAQLGRAHHFDLSYNDTAQSFGFLPYESDSASLRYTGAAGTRFTSEVLAARTSIGASTDVFSARASYAFGDHLPTVGFTSDRGEGPDFVSLYASDRWSYSRWNVYAGLRYDDAEFSNRLSPRLAVSYDVRGNGAHAIAASWGEYAPAAQPANALRVLTLGYAMAIGTSGTARVDVLRRESRGFWQNELQLDARYRLFDRFEAGGTYTLANRIDSGFMPLFPEQNANVWLGAEVPVGGHEFGATLLQRYLERYGRTVAPTDLALRYTIPLSRLGLVLAVDATNVLLAGDEPFLAPRAMRVWIRVRV